MKITAMTAAALLSSPLWAKTVAVLGYKDTATGAVTRPELADDLRARLPLSRGGDTVLDANVVRTRLRGPPGAPTALVATKATLAAADEAAAAVEHERAVGLFEAAIVQLQNDRDFSLEKRELLQTARLRCARLLLGLAGPAETGKAETPQGKKATQHLENALRIDPMLVLDAKSTPPKLRALLGLAQERLKAGGHGGAVVVSSPPGATVYLDGRALGLTPMTTANDSIPYGRYRLWLASPGRSSSARSFARVVEVGELPVQVDINIAVEGTIDAERPGLITPVQPLNQADIRQLELLLEAEDVIVVGVHGGKGFVVEFDDQGRVVASGTVGADADADAVVAFLGGGAPTSVTTSTAPEAWYTSTMPRLVAASDDGAMDNGGFPWLMVGVGTGVVVAAASVAAALYFTRSASFDLTLTEQP